MKKLATLLLVLLPLACARGPKKPKPGPDTAAVVNGVAIEEAEVKLLTSSMGHGAGGDRRAAVLDNLVQQELAAQKAEKLGLDKDPVFVAAMKAADAQYAVLRRRELALAWSRKEIDAGAIVTDDEVRTYFEANVTQLRTEYFVQQVFRRDRAAIEAAQAKLAAGTPFEEVAAEGYPELPPDAKKSWELGPLTFRQLPDPWKAPLEKLAVGAVTGVVEGEGNRFWILRLMQRVENPDTGYAQLAEGLKAQLRSEKVEAIRAQKQAALLAGAKVEKRPAPVVQER